MSATPERAALAEAGVAADYYGQRAALARDRRILEQLIEAVGWTNDLAPYQWAQWYATTLAFRPDLIIELGRGNGNSTALFCQAVITLGTGRIESICWTRAWNRTRSRIEPLVPSHWFEPLNARTQDIRAVNFDALIGNSERILVLWDAHGFAIAEKVLSDLLPHLVQRPHLLILHDISDARYFPMGTQPAPAEGHAQLSAVGSYSGHRLWRGGDWANQKVNLGSRVRIGWMDSAQEQIVALADFLGRNGLELGSADHDYHRFFGGNPSLEQEMRNAIGASMFSTEAQWAYFQLPAGRTEFHLPPVAPSVRSGTLSSLRSRVVSRGVRALRSLDPNI